MAKPPSHNDDEISSALAKAGGVIAVASKMLGISRKALDERVRRSPALIDVRDTQRETLLDIAEANLANKIRGGNLRAIIFFLTTQGKGRGYTTRTEVTGADGQALSGAADIATLPKTARDSLQAALEAAEAAAGNDS